MKGTTHSRRRNDEERSCDSNEVDAKIASLQRSPYKEKFKQYGMYFCIAIPLVISIITLCGFIFLTKSPVVTTHISSLSVNVQTDGVEFHTPMTFHASLGLQSFLYSAKLIGDKSTHCTLYAPPIDSLVSSPQESITDVTLLTDVLFKSRDLLANCPMHETDIDVALSQTSMETLKALFKQPSNADMHMHCQVKMVIYAYGIFPIAFDARLIKDDQIKGQVSILGKYIPVWQSSNVDRHVEYSHASNDNLTNSHAVPLAALKQSIRSNYHMENTTFSVQNAYSVFSSVLASSTLLPFPLYISMAPIEIDLKPITPDATIDTNYWKISVAPFLVSLSPFSDSTVSAPVT
eukprot:CAMPEP_0119038480 /NCGR_PEP_ID=MMETSP1177-20130426/7441_1 /TAXON_ID=2985 /ORGANISM="Ochromonas sp, Strain CCMP1899" /LENGTH=347 /DNA_ID=CAMNT_0007001129 /DNA_START=84 /DNA_END=1123 /DNA_ORIENTATION=+